MRAKVLLAFALALLMGLLVPAAAVASGVWTHQVGGQLREISFADADNGWAVGAYGLVRRTTNGGATWTTQNTSGLGLEGVSAVDAANAWAVGNWGRIIHTSNGGATWTTQVSGTTSYLGGVSFVDAQNGWAAGSGGTILRTSNGGLTWTPQNSGTTASLMDVSFVDAQNGWAVGLSGAVVHTSDGGATWTTQTSGTTANLFDMTFTDANNGWAVGEGGTVIKTSNGGATWTTQTSGTTVLLQGVSFSDSNNGWAVGHSKLLRTTDGGTTWTSQGAGAAEQLITVAALGADGACATGNGPAIMLTTDGGSEWTYITPSLNMPAGRSYNGVSLADEDNGWAVGDGGTILHTTTGGGSWPEQDSGTSQNLLGVDGVDTDTAWAVGASGTVLRTGNAGATWASQTSGTSDALTSVSAVDTETAWAVGGNGVILHTADGGATWTSQTSGTTQTLNGVSAVDTATAWAVGGSGTILHTADGGSTWTTQTSGITQALYGVSFADSNNGWAVGAAAKILHTSDGGATWSLQTPGYYTDTFYGVSCTSANDAWAVGALSNIYHTSNGGATWASQPKVPDYALVALESVDFFDADNGLAAGGGYIMRSGDITPPVSAITAPTDGAALNGTTYAVTGTASDDFDVAAVEVSTDGGSTWHTATGTTSWSYTWTLPADGEYTIKSRAYDSAGNQEAPGAGVTVTIDNTAPSTQLTTTPMTPDGENGWFIAAPSVSLSIGEPGTTYYQWDSTSGAWSQYLDSFVAPEGAHTLYYYSVDLLGNVETLKSLEIDSDDKAPTMDVKVNGNWSGTGWYSADVVVSMDATDNAGGSGIAEKEYSFDGSEWTTYTAPFTVSDEGTTTVYLRTSDVAGNVPGTETAVVTIDKTAPTTEAGVSGTLGLNGWYTSDVVLSLNATDTGGAGLYVTECSVGPRFYTAPVTVSIEGTNLIRYRAADNAGTIEDVHEMAIKIDKTDPLSWYKIAGQRRPNGTFAGTVLVTVHAADELYGSGLETVEYSFDGGTWLDYTEPFEISDEGTTEFFFRATDKAGHVGDANSMQVTIDSTP